MKLVFTLLGASDLFCFNQLGRYRPVANNQMPVYHIFPRLEYFGKFLNLYLAKTGFLLCDLTYALCGPHKPIYISLQKVQDADKLRRFVFGETENKDSSHGTRSRTETVIRIKVVVEKEAKRSTADDDGKRANEEHMNFIKRLWS
ncbi:hypothetical protein RUM43_007957 [Polyplax serrata]|uniref:Uncharacterized protein n=1 Tax=Polyplax serrata TaxID=468196 RepID=A0AAN8P2K7_POLSC